MWGLKPDEVLPNSCSHWMLQTAMKELCCHQPSTWLLLSPARDPFFSLLPKPQCFPCEKKQECEEKSNSGVRRSWRHGTPVMGKDRELKQNILVDQKRCWAKILELKEHLQLCTIPSEEWGAAGDAQSWVCVLGALEGLFLQPQQSLQGAHHQGIPV